ncbi:hypothetical protein KVR01_013271 [Diaporthe batatas]|uniref:uncharacterized protein n=1 Tax=Diaporthe batatas TaxID=748121 RepID=UPI001D044FD6|nr:uncharacterized protein KVR01_013271 [Diaporthe batatas]KAG8156858.1 hypothetical protein KVR01_013271 [Diaporthe batatas]
MADVEILREWNGPPPLSGVTIPSAATIKAMCVDISEQQGGYYPMKLAYPPGEQPTLWIKYGPGVFWDELVNQTRLHQELQKIDSPVRVPAVYYAFTDSKGPRWTYIVMEYIRGETVGSLERKARESQPPEQCRETLEGLHRRVAFVLDEFLRIPVPAGTPPASISGALIRHPVFGIDQEAPRPYENVEQLEQHFNMFIELPGMRRRKLPLLRGLSQEPMVFCHCDVNDGNFMINEMDEIVVLDFGMACILPLSFAKYITLTIGHDGLGRAVRPWVHLPDMGGQSCANADVLMGVQGPMIQSGSSFDRIMRRVPGCPPPRDIF